MNEDLKKTLGSIGLAGLTALGSLGIGSDAQAAPAKKSTNQSITRTVKKNTPKPVAVSKVNTMNVFEKYKSINPYFPDFLNAIHQVESSGKITGNSPIMGDNGRARGPFQIHKEYWEDVKNIVGGKYEDVDNLDYAAKVVASYMLKYAKNAIQNGNFVVAAKRHNGGPNGDKKSATQEYARKVMSKMPSEYAMAKKENINGISIV